MVGASRQPARCCEPRGVDSSIDFGQNLRRTKRLDVSRHATKACLLQHEWHWDRVHVLYIIYVFDLFLHLYWGVYLTIYVSYIRCGSYCGVCFMLCGQVYSCQLHVCKWISGYEYFIYTIDSCNICLDLTHVTTDMCLDVLFLEVSTHLYSTDTLTRAHTHWRTRNLKTLRWWKSVSLTVSTLLPTGG